MNAHPAWRKSSYSSSQGDNCIELADLDGTIGVRDSKNPEGGHLSISRDGLRVLLAGLKQR
ncbi:DUF397 domain-containing protein [Actinomadura nitritigenes]|uniref:DUF397 domain-containing protein n=1 Tax=Actinomadura nitritigenes TaxID=134602 RepID=A0ABS3RFY1_9ACTN|nr:DUF397 domain-containing protein [Actinomadura nitritigenes]MBO2445143.1 DUF397 domain-containing protein [Actinomadura nitritigenes]